MSAPPTLECAHCSDDVAIPLVTLDGIEDHWLHDGQVFTCETCGGVNVVTCDRETPAEFRECEDEHCAACGLAVA